MSTEFVLREQNYESKVLINAALQTTIRVSRTRTSSGDRAIFLKVGEQKRIEFSSGKYGDKYTEVVTQIIELLTAALEDPCTLPKM